MGIVLLVEAGPRWKHAIDGFGVDELSDRDERASGQEPRPCLGRAASRGAAGGWVHAVVRRLVRTGVSMEVP